MDFEYKMKCLICKVWIRHGLLYSHWERHPGRKIDSYVKFFKLVRQG